LRIARIVWPALDDTRGACKTWAGGRSLCAGVRIDVTTLQWIFASGLAMSAIAMVGGVTLLLREETLQRILSPLVAFAAGNFIYIGASDLVPEVNKHRDASSSRLHFMAFAAGLLLLWMLRVVFDS
jgi:zinc transporter ZupT